MHLFQVRIAKLANKETDLGMEQGADLHSAAVPVDMSPSFKRRKSRALGYICLYLKETLFPWDKSETCHHSKQSKVVVPEMIHHLSILPCYPEARSFGFCETPEVTVAEGRVARGSG